MGDIKISRTFIYPDLIRINRYKKAPELGPKILFFSGGSSLRDLSSTLIEYTHNSIHLITPFDSGGSSAKIRKAFDMLSVGDIRNRLMALADQSLHGNPDVYALFSHRLPLEGENSALEDQLFDTAQGKTDLMKKIPNPLKRIIRNHIHYFIERKPEGFDLRGASIGNIILTGGYLINRRHIEPVIFLFSKLVEARGQVKPITGKSFHLCIESSDGALIKGQHLITGKEAPPLSSPVKNLFLISDLKSDQPVKLEIKEKIKSSIRNADLICYPYGSFYTSLIANLLPFGVGDAIASAETPKVYIPNIKGDPEQVGMTLFHSVKTLIRYLMACSSKGVPVSKLLDYVVVNRECHSQPSPLDLEKIKDLGVRLIEAPLSSIGDKDLYDPQKVCDLLLSLT